MPFLRRLVFVLSILVAGFVASKVQAQSDARTHFIYIQSENQQPYYVILNKKSYSSSSVGYLIISKLADGDYNVTVGFPQDAFPATTYLLKINGTDAGFSLKKGSGKKWNLIDKLSQKALTTVDGDADNADVATPDKSADNGQKSNNSFGALLSKTSTDTTNYAAYANKPKSNPDNTDTAPKATMPTGTTTDATIAAGASEKKGRGRTGSNTSTPKATNEFDNETYESTAARSATQSIVKVAERSDRRGVSLDFVVSSGEKIDTVNAFFPGDSKKGVTEDEEEEARAKTASVSPEKAALKQEVDGRKSTENPFYKGTTNNTNKNNSDLALFSDDKGNGTTATAPKKATKATKVDDEVTKQDGASKEIFNSTCTSTVTDKDMEKIRKKMIAKSTDEEMIAIARKMVDTKCIYTAQIKELGGLLISDNGRFALYRILYPNVYDGGQFSTLESQLLDKSFKSQFESLISNR